MILYELILYKVCGLRFVLFFCLWIFNCLPHLFLKKTYPSSIEYLLLLCQKSVDCTCVDLSLAFLFCFIDLCIYSSIRHIILNTVVIQ